VQFRHFEWRDGDVAAFITLAPAAGLERGGCDLQKTPGAGSPASAWPEGHAEVAQRSTQIVSQLMLSDVRVQSLIHSWPYGALTEAKIIGA
jgi:hypothetical protein